MMRFSHGHFKQKEESSVTKKVNGDVTWEERGLDSQTQGERRRKS